MRILSWNINGIRTIPHYHPWNKLKNWDAILQELKAEIICLQEIKTTRAAIGRTVALPDNFDAFLSFHASKGGYSGVAVYTDSRTVVPLKAEEGLSGKLQPKLPLTPDERISRSYPYAHEMGLMPDVEGNTPSDLATLDWEGRALVLDFGLFVLINLYCPNETSDERLPFKMNYHLMLRGACAQAGRGREARGWNTKISARETNYGTRIDYILITPGLVPWVKHGDIQPDIKGSDHCPVYIDLHEEITTGTGEKLSLRDAMKIDGRKRDPPRIATKFWDEHRRKQTLLSGFFGKGNGTKSPPDAAVVSAPEPVSQLSMEQDNIPPSIGQSDLAAAFDVLESSRALSPIADTPAVDQPEPSSSQTASVASTKPSPTISISTRTSTTSQAHLPSTQPTPSPPIESLRPSQKSRKRRRPEPTPSIAGPSNSQKAKKLKAGQTKLSSFFAKPSTTHRPSSEIIEIDDDADADEDPAPPSQSTVSMDCDDLERQIDADHFGFPGIVEDEADAETLEAESKAIAAEQEGERRGRKAFVGVRRLLEMVHIRQETLQGWVDEMVQATL
ncbi:hypothetical protein EWM64_g8342 [Hericium alpestre]|uniref:Endonuclease/exonuclease/phosphatase domain-containing protein n=1 Tax=Hericium alpestre TaxID=135208 RepID=A0A4Y9ZPB1_9AGAM|nr:hypothetical protein EWM64_g8342 [Hericium alpestre]